MKPPPMNHAQLSAARAYLLAKTHAECIRAIVEPIQAEAMRVWKPTVSAKWSERAGNASEVITEYKSLYLADDSACGDIYADIRSMIAKRHPSILPENPDHCPLLVAESLVTDAERIVVETFAEWEPIRHLGFTWDNLLCTGVKNMHRFVNLVVGLCVTSNPKEFADANAVLRGAHEQ